MGTEYELERMVVRLTGDSKLYKQMLKESVAETKMAMSQIDSLLTDSEARWATYREELESVGAGLDEVTKASLQFNSALRQGQVDLVRARGGMKDMADELQHLTEMTGLMAGHQADVERQWKAANAQTKVAGDRMREAQQEADILDMSLKSMGDNIFKMPGILQKVGDAWGGFTGSIKASWQETKNYVKEVTASGFEEAILMVGTAIQGSSARGGNPNQHKSLITLKREEAELIKKTARMQAARDAGKEKIQEIGDAREESRIDLDNFGKTQEDIAVEQFREKVDQEGGMRTQFGDTVADEAVAEFETNVKMLANKQAMKQIEDERAQTQAQLVEGASEMTDFEFEKAQAIQQYTLALKEQKSLTDKQREDAVEAKKMEMEKLNTQQKQREWSAEEKSIMEERSVIGKTDLQIQQMRLEKLAEEGKISEDQLQTAKAERAVNEELKKEAAERVAEEEKLKAAKEEIKAYEDEMKKGNMQAGMTDEQKQLDDYRRMLEQNVELTKAERDERLKVAEAQIKQNTAAEKQKEHQKEIKELMKELDKSTRNFGLEGGDLAAEEAREKGATSEQQEAIRSKTDMLEALGAEKELTEQMLEPMEKYQKKVKDLDKWHKTLGTQFDKTYNKSMKEANKQLRADQKAKWEEEAGNYQSNGMSQKFDDEYYAIIENTRKMKDYSMTVDPEIDASERTPTGGGDRRTVGGGDGSPGTPGSPGGSDGVGGLASAGIPLWERMATSLEELVKKPTLEVTEIGLV